MFQELFEKIVRAFDEPGKKPSRAKAKPVSTGKDRRKSKRASATDRRKSKLRIQDWNERDSIRRRMGIFHWEGYVE